MNLSLIDSQASGIEMKCVGLLRFLAESTISSILDLADNTPYLSGPLITINGREISCKDYMITIVTKELKMD